MVFRASHLTALYCSNFGLSKSWHTMELVTSNDVTLISSFLKIHPPFDIHKQDKKVWHHKPILHQTIEAKIPTLQPGYGSFFIYITTYTHTHTQNYIQHKYGWNYDMEFYKWHGYMFWPLGGHFKSLKYITVKLQLQLHVHFVTLRSQSLGLQYTCQYKVLKPIKDKIRNLIAR